jgi:uncharacterized protein (TIGR02266 family)
VDDRRRHPRIKLQVDVDVRSEHNFFTTRTLDASEGGLFIETNLPLEVGTLVDLQLHLPGVPSREIKARVAWALADLSGATTGLGLEFVSLEPRLQDAIADFMQRRAPLTFDSEEPAEEPAEDAAEDAADPPSPPPLPRRG